jgi:transcriptional regulator with XRE-family HTH domain
MTDISDYMTDAEILQIIGERYRNNRLSRNISVDDAATTSGVNRKTILAFEAGEAIRTSSMVKLLRGLNMIGGLNAVAPDVLPGGEGLSSRGQPRLKAAPKRK